jgi:AcrR family transcriptional regulator
MPEGGGRAVVGGRLGRYDVLVAAEAIVDRDGWMALTMSALAKELGVKSPSLYHHVDGLDAVRAEVQSRTMQALTRAQVTGATGQAGLDGIRELAAAHRSFALRYPNRYLGLTGEVVDRRRLQETVDGVLGLLGEVVLSTGLSEQDLSSAMVALFAALHGVIVLEISHFFEDRIDIDAVFWNVVEGSLRTIQDVVARAQPAED